MIARLQKFLHSLSETFWLVPALLVAAGLFGALGLVRFDRSGLLTREWLEASWLYDGGATGARTLLGAIASSTIGVAGTVFSITIAALTLAAGQMGPRLLRNFTRDRGNQVTLGIFLGTFAFTLMVLRSVRTEAEGEFVPHVALSVAILLAFVCVATLVFFVGHMASRINVDTVVEIVSNDLRQSIRALTVEEPQPARPAHSFWSGAAPVKDARRGYLQQLDQAGLAEWARQNKTSVRLLVRPGHFIFPGAPIALVKPSRKDAAKAITIATALGTQRISSVDLEFSVRQLVEVAVRALSPGINDPNTAMSVLDRLGEALCDIAGRHLPTGVTKRDGKIALVVPLTGYDGLTDSMFHLIRQYAQNSVPVLIHLLDVLTVVASCDQSKDRRKALQRHADLVLRDAKDHVRNKSDLKDIAARHKAFGRMRTKGAVAL